MAFPAATTRPMANTVPPDYRFFLTMYMEIHHIRPKLRQEYDYNHGKADHIFDLAGKCGYT